jgi:ABC-type nitrate/sulfonate/bicarbonate transport system substrate-binding protein
MMKRRGPLIAVLLVLLAITFAATLASHRDDTATVRILYTGNTQGYLEPCG